MTLLTNDQIENYANSMFAHDALNEAWISQCSQYLSSVFGADRLRGATVLDYAFGRGNWALAFLQAGASRVVAIDASKNNVIRFSTYCQINSIRNIDIFQGNVLEEEVNQTFDIVWLYGILHHIEQSQLFLDRIADCLANDTSEVFVYSYNEGCLRERVVSAARLGVVYQTSAEFERDALLFSPSARLRARDDLTSPWIDWYSANALRDLLLKSNLTPCRPALSFADFLKVPSAPEFSPHHFICRRTSGSQSATFVSEIDCQIDEDYCIIGDLADWIVEKIGEEKKNFAIGFFNTHFPALQYGNYAKCISDDFLFLLYCWHKNGLDLPDDPILAMYLTSGISAAAGSKRSLPEDVIQRSGLARFLCSNSIRL